MPLSLNELLDATVNCGLVDAATAAQIRGSARRDAGDPVRTISLLARIPSAAVMQAAASARNLEYIAREQYRYARDLVQRLPSALVRRRLVLPIQEDRDSVLIAMGDPDGVADLRLRETLQRVFDKTVRFGLADAAELQRFIEQHDEVPVIAGAGVSVSAPDAGLRADDAVAFVNEIICEAFIRRASDIHLEPDATTFRVRMRIDGSLQIWRDRVPVSLAIAALSRLKVLAQMDIAESRESQDGSLVYELQGAQAQKLDIRMATAPTKHGERATLRLLGSDSKDLTLSDLGFSPDMHARFRELIKRPSGLLLLTGPTGSGKSTTLYAALREINRPELNIMTVEDPVEYSIAGVSQLEVDQAGKVTFSSVLRSLLRHDPDVLMVGEIRDKETADIALRAAMTGHLVFSTLHTSTAVGTVTRLMDMQCDAYMIGATLTAAVSQRLVRRLCPGCRTPREATAEERQFLGVAAGADAIQIHAPRGCLRCQNRGFSGRIALCEMFCVDDAARDAMCNGLPERAIAKACTQLTTLREDAIQKVLAGMTTIDEVRTAVLLEES